MRRRLLLLVIVAVVVAAVIGTYKISYRMGQSDGRDAAIANRNAFQTRVAGAGSAPAGGQGAGPRGSAAGGTATTGTPAAGGSPGASGGAPGRGANQTGVAGRVTKVDGAVLNIQQADNTTVTVTTTAQTMVRNLVSGMLTDLKAGEFVAIDGTRSGDTVTAKTITGFGDAAPAGGGAAGGRPAGGSGSGASGGAITGQVRNIGLDGGSLTIQGSDGTTLTVKTDPSTVVRTQQAGALSDIKTGDLLFIQGDKTGDAAYAARTITDQGAVGG